MKQKEHKYEPILDILMAAKQCTRTLCTLETRVRHRTGSDVHSFLLLETY
jgi:hypothetical protein